MGELGGNVEEEISLVVKIWLEISGFMGRVNVL
jgi:hypothetical protein